MDRRHFLAQTLLAGVIVSLPAALRAQGTVQGTTPSAAQGRTGATPLPPLTVYKSTTCGCCRAWVDHMRSAGFTVRTVDTEDLGRVKGELGVPGALQSCHTAVIGAFLVEGHVPAADVKRLLAQKPAVRGLAVPGMPVGSPGMEQGDPHDYDRYEVMAFTAQGRTSVFARH
ncbi:MAG: DUF411 domain-containing protein [Gemmatimonadota bacterium]